MKKLVLTCFVLADITILSLIGIVWWISHQAQDRLYESLSVIEFREVGLVFGTTPRVADGRRNLFFHHRIQAAKELYEADKIDTIIVSGDNEVESYNEPEYMKQALMEEGIPEDDIILDYAGFNTRDSVLRAKEVFGQSRITFISQKFQLERALFVASDIELDAIGYIATGIDFEVAPRVYLREVLARIKAFYDNIVDTPPRFLGESINI